MVFKSFIHKIENFIWNFLSFIKQDLFFVVLPVKSEILYSNGVPMVGKLHSSGVHYSLDFIWNYKFKILSSILIADEKAVLYFYHSNEVIFFSLLQKRR